MPDDSLSSREKRKEKKKGKGGGGLALAQGLTQRFKKGRAGQRIYPALHERGEGGKDRAPYRHGRKKKKLRRKGVNRNRPRSHLHSEQKEGWD